MSISVSLVVFSDCVHKKWLVELIQRFPACELYKLVYQGRCWTRSLKRNNGAAGGEVCEVGVTVAMSIKDLAWKTEGCYLYDNTEPSSIIAELRVAAVPVYRFRQKAPLVKHVLQKGVWLSMMDGVCLCARQHIPLRPEMLILSFYIWLDGVSARAWLRSKSKIKSGIHVLSQS